MKKGYFRIKVFIEFIVPIRRLPVFLQLLINRIPSFVELIWWSCSLSLRHCWRWLCFQCLAASHSLLVHSSWPMPQSGSIGGHSAEGQRCAGPQMRQLWNRQPARWAHRTNDACCPGCASSRWTLRWTTQPPGAGAPQRGGGRGRLDGHAGTANL